MVTQQASPLPRRQSQYALAMLAIVYAICIVDRKILTILQEPIKAEFHLADWQLGLLTGFSFAALYSVLGIPIARIADRGARRVTIISIALAVWSVMTAACGLTINYAQLLLMRVGVGIGEAGCSPPSLSLLADYFPRSGRGRAMGVYALASPVGTAIGLSVGGWLALHLGWRHALMIVGLPGALLALIFWFTVREPPRSIAASTVPQQSVWKTIVTLLRIPTYAWLLLACSLASFASYAVQFWFPSFFVRSYKLTLGEVGLWWGLCSGAAGLAGSLGGGWLADKLGARNPRAILAAPAFALLFAIPLQIVATRLGVFGPSLACAALLAVLNQLWIAPNMMLTQSLVEPSMRATSAAVSTFAANIIGLGTAPVVLGMISDMFSRGSGNSATGLGSALAVVTVVYVFAAAAFLMASRTIHRDLRD